MNPDFLVSARKEFLYYKQLAENTIQQVPEEKLFWQFNNESNSIAIIMKHMVGNMLSRWTDFLTSDGEKEWRERDREFEPDTNDKSALMDAWEKGWTCLFSALDALSTSDLDKIIYIRNMGHTVLEAVNRQLAHYPYHVGQMVYIGKMVCGESWRSLSIPKNQSQTYNAEQFSRSKVRRHYTDGARPATDSNKSGGIR